MYLSNRQKTTYHVIDIEADSLTPTKIHCAVVTPVIYHADGTPPEAKEPVHFRPKDLGALTLYINKHNEKPRHYWVGHNAINFDIPVLNRLLGTTITVDDTVDTLVLSFLYHPHIPGGHSLKAWGERFQFPKGDFDDWSKFSEEMLEYCEQDVAITVRVFMELRDRMLFQKYTELSCEIEHKISAIIQAQKDVGVSFDERGASILLASLSTVKQKLEDSIFEVFPPELTMVDEYEFRRRKDGKPWASYTRHQEFYPKVTFNASGTRYRTYEWTSFNIGSPKQRVERLTALGWTATEFTPITRKGGGGNPKVTEDSLLAFADEQDIPQVKLIAEWMTVNNRINSLTEWLGHVGEDGRIHGSVFSCGAGTRRMRHFSPNTANICGVDKPYGLEMRSKWRPLKGRVMVGIDAKGLEGRVLMHYLDNPDAVEVFMEGDVHQLNADAIGEALGIRKPRKTAKNDYYAFLYGASDTKLGLMNGGSRFVGAKVRAAIKGNVPGLAELTQSIENEYNLSSFGWLETIDGGFVRCPSPHSALNYKCQSAGAILMKLAMIYLDGWIDKTRCMKVLDVHDEWQFESDPDYADELGELGCKAIRDAGKTLGFNVPMDGDYKVGKDWSETH